MDSDRRATQREIEDAIQKHQPFPPGTRHRIVMPEAYPTEYKWRKKQHRCLIINLDTNQIMMSAGSAYEMLDKIKGGAVWSPEPSEGLFA